MTTSHKPCDTVCSLQTLSLRSAGRDSAALAGGLSASWEVMVSESEDRNPTSDGTYKVVDEVLCFEQTRKEVCSIRVENA